MNEKLINERDLHSSADGRLGAARRAEVDAWLAEHPDTAARVADWSRQNAMLRETYDGVLDEPIPARLLQASRPRWKPLRIAAAFAWIALGGIIGFASRSFLDRPQAIVVPLARQAAVAHAVFSPEVRHPVEVGADQEAHLVTWLSKRLGSPMKAPNLGSHGFDLVGGRLLAGESGPSAQLMYQDRRGQRLTLYVKADRAKDGETAFRFAQEGRIGVFYWIDGGLGYALSGEIERAELLAVASTVYRQLNP